MNGVMVRGLTLIEPWATLVALGKKRMETRSWSTSYRGLVAVHSAKKFPELSRALCLEDPFMSALNGYGLTRRFGFGHIVGIVKLVSCVPTGRVNLAVDKEERAFGDFEPGRFAFGLEDAYMLPEPVPCRGALWLWKMPEGAAAVLKGEVDRYVEMVGR